MKNRMNTVFQAALMLDVVEVVASPRIELGSGASEALILSIVLRGQFILDLILKI